MRTISAIFWALCSAVLSTALAHGQWMQPAVKEVSSAPSQTSQKSAVTGTAGASGQPAFQPSSRFATQSDSSGVPTFRSDVKLVNLFVTVLTMNGAPVTDLNQTDFKIFEDGVPEKIAIFRRESELPLSIVLAIDTSLSTKKDLKLELDSARRFSHSILRPQDSLSVFQFSDVVDQLSPFSANLKLIDGAINRVHTGSATALYDALYLGSESLEERRGRKVIVVITDGGDTVSKVDYAEALREAQQAEAIVYSIIVVPIENDAGRDLGGEHALIQISRDTGGKYFYAGGLKELDAAFHRISDELRTQYLLAYYPSRRVTSSEFRRLRVQVGHSNDSNAFVVRHRAGYYTTKSR
jgi:Ca-activated chloride channel family protein